MGGRVHIVRAHLKRGFYCILVQFCGSIIVLLPLLLSKMIL